MTESCHACPASAVLRYRILPHRHLAVSQVWPPGPRWVLSCPARQHQEDALKQGTVMRTDSLEDGEPAVRVVKEG